MDSIQHSKFRGNPEDYLEWFNLGYAKANEIVLPPSTTSTAKRRNALVEKPKPQRCDFGNSYAQKYIVEHNQFVKESLRSCPLLMKQETKVTEGLDEISTVADTEITDFQNKLSTENLTYVYWSYTFDQRDETTARLPVQNYRKEILQKIDSFSVIVVEGSTGCGKSTQVPQFILDDGWSNWRHVNILVTQPRKIAAISLAKRVCEERGWKVGSLVGHQVGLSSEVSQDTRLTYATTEVLVQKAINKKTLSEYTHIILDEIHERDQHTDFALLIVKKFLYTVSKNVKIILMSATIDCEKFAGYFSSEVDGHLFPAPIVSITDKCCYNLQVYYLESLGMAFPENKMPAYDPDEPGISQEMLDMSVTLMERLDDLERADADVELPDYPENRGAVLMFLPGLHEIEAVIERVKTRELYRRWVAIPLHSSFTLEEQKAAFGKMVPGFRKIIISTNIAESSITVPDIMYVIDFCLTKELNCDPVTNYTCLKMAWTSKASCTQRAGRAGRVASGRVYRLIEEHFFDELEPHSTPELARTPLSQAVLKIKLLNMGAPIAMLALALDPPDMNDIQRTVLVLKQAGALALKCEGNVSAVDGDLTYLGRVAAALPLDIKLSKLIVMGHLFGCLKETIVIAAGLSLKNIHSTPFQDELNAFLSKVSWAYGSFSDCLSIYNTYYIWERFNMTGSFKKETKSCPREKEWAKSSYVQLESLREVNKLVKELTERLVRLKIFRKENSLPHEKETQPLFVKMCMAAAFYPNYFKRFVPDDYERSICRELSGHDPFITVMMSGLPSDTNFLYDDQIKKMFKDCSKDLSVSYEGSKAFVQFSKLKNVEDGQGTKHLQDIPGTCPTAMHLALKMRQVNRFRTVFGLNLYSTDEANERLAIILSEGKEFDRFERRRIIHQDFEFKPPIMPHPSVQVWHILVTCVKNPTMFWGISSESRRVQEESYLRSMIDLSEGDVLPPNRVIPKMPCLAPYFDPFDKTEKYYRARIEESFEGGERAGKVLVFFVDYGNTEIVKATSLRIIPEKLMQVPQLAIEYSLSEIKPPSIGRNNVENVWTSEAITWLSNHTLNKEFVGKIYSVVHNVIRIELFDMLEIPHEGPRKSLNRILIEKGFACKAEEFYLSKQNHELRGLYGPEIPTRFTKVSSTLSSSLSTSSLNVSSSDIGLPRSVNRRPLRGPYSPLEMKFVALTQNGCMKGVKVDQASVNSIALDFEPQCPYDKLLVSAQVVLNPSESSLVLRSTTLMPALPGMLPLCLLLFSPFVELRCNELGSEYAGALCGLGYDPKKKSAVYPEDDIEIQFDFTFTTQDLNKINSLRYMMSSTLAYHDEQTIQDLYSSQKFLRELVLEIISKKREYVEPQSFRNSSKWNQGEKEKILYPDLEEGTEIAQMVWPPHNGIALCPAREDKSVLVKTRLLRKLHDRLKQERRLDSFIVNAYCPLCNQTLKCFSDLQVHLILRSHVAKEQKVYGC